MEHAIPKKLFQLGELYDQDQFRDRFCPYPPETCILIG